MNWKEIQQKCPKAYNECAKWVDETLMPINEKSTIPPDLNQINIRDLYDFFDENGIYVVVLYNGIAPHGCHPGFWSEINNRPYNKTNIKRIDTEQDAFTKAFEILENEF